VVDGAKLRAIRELQNKSLEEVGRSTGLSAHTIMRIETGFTKDPGIETLTLITKALLVDLHDVLTEDEEGETNE
jgi:transcriptional regulator with XRE-family HTH domain